MATKQQQHQQQIAAGRPQQVNGRPQHQQTNNGVHPATGRPWAPATIQRTLTNTLRRRRKPNKPDYSAINPCVKYFLFIINFSFMLVGLAFAVAGTYILVEKSKTVKNFIDFIFDPACDLCLAGLIILVIAFFGCGGALREYTLFLRIYYILLMIFLLLELVLVTFVFVFYFVDGAFASVGLYPEDAFLDAIKSYRDDPDMQSFIDTIQQTLSCCGASNDDNGYEDWGKNPYFNCSSKSYDSCSVPFSCCIIREGDNINYRCGVDMLKDLNPALINVQGCLKGVQSLIKDNVWIVGGAVIGILIPQAIFIWCAKALVYQVHEQMSKW